MKNYRYSGNSISFTATEELESGQPYQLGDSFGVIAKSLSPGQPGELFIEGAFKLPKDPAVEIKIGQKLFWDPSHQRLTGGEEIEKEGKLKAAGIAVELWGAESVTCKLNGVAL